MIHKPKRDKPSSVRDIKPDIILVGGDHYNGLSLARLFGKEGLNPYGIIVRSKSGGGFLRTSKYWKTTWSVKSDEEIIDVLIKHFSCKDPKPVVLPWSDGAAAVIDSNLDLLLDSFVVPSINRTQSRINQLMDKGAQVEFAAECGLDVAASTEIKLDSSETGLNRIPFPCIGKPIVSIEGEKGDIRKCETAEELKEYLLYLKEKRYERIFLQEYVSIDTEYDVEGFVSGDYSSFFVEQKVRTWPTIGGPTTYAFSVDDADVNAAVEVIIRQLKTMKYSGLFDVELFRVGDRLLFNEINWRNSAVCFAAIESGVKYPLYWYEAEAGIMPALANPGSYGRYAMCELLDVHNVGAKVRMTEWLGQLLHCDAYAYYDSSDPLPLTWKIGSGIIRKLPGGRSL